MLCSIAYLSGQINVAIFLEVVWINLLRSLNSVSGVKNRLAKKIYIRVFAGLKLECVRSVGSGGLKNMRNVGKCGKSCSGDK